MKLTAHPRPVPQRRQSIGSLRGLISVAGVLVILLYMCLESTGRAPSFDLQHILLSVPASEYARNWSRYYTSETHLAGQGLSQAQWTEAQWKNLGIANTRIFSYDTELPAPSDRQRLVLSQGGEVLYKAPLVDNNSTAGFVPAYFGFSPNANISGSYVYCNFGRPEDYEALSRANVNVTGKIGILKLGNASPFLRQHGMEIFRVAQISNAEKAGLIGVVLYTDPQNDGPVSEANGFKPYPDGPARPLAAIERGGIGNPEDVRQNLLPKIPSIPISITDATHLLKALDGHGPLANDLGEPWRGGALGFYGVNYNVGPSPSDISLHLVNHADVIKTQIHNVIGTIPGIISDEVVIVGNHRDAWGPGAGDPGSGSAALNEVVRSYGVALQHGWQPLRTIVFASFEGEEFAQIGSLLWIADHLEWLKATAVAYLNVVVAASGSHFHAKASPLLYRAVLAATGHVPSPNQTISGQSVRDVWDGTISTAGGGDANRFQGVPCVSTADIGFSTGLEDAVFPYHTGFDSFEWMDTLGDPEWKYHVTSAKILSLMTAHLTESPVLDMSVADYATALEGWLDIMTSNDQWSSKVDLSMLVKAVQRLSPLARQFDSYAESLKYTDGAWWKLWGKPWGICKSKSAIHDVNKVYIAFERQFYDEAGLDGYPSLHHVLFGLASWHNNVPAMPGLYKSLTAGNWANAERWRNIVAEKVGDASRLLEEHLHNIHRCDKGLSWMNFHRDG
ncbi:hypothetical protein F4777DRAFT_596606 [Nemania sp. FL0916]|nr:hypothetical protein F4777DRAFT_596606 [Nemania sp. FL0916]